MPENTFTFSEEDFEAIIKLHNDTLVILFLLNNTRIKCVLVDPGNSTNIIRSEVVGQLGLLDRVTPIPRVLHSFNIADEVTKGEITLPIDTSNTIQNTEYQVIDGDMRYNALLGRPWIHSMKAVPSTLHQVIKFPTKDGIMTIHRELWVAKEMFAVHHKALIPTHPISDKVRNTQTPEDDEEDFFAPRTFVAPEESDATKSIVE
uniref:Peptidase A2B Ty3 transposon peptidase domain-containing protein n=2 Tax=Nicotiana TaxID=4085 RepID=A0A1S4ATD9_TOBAC|nr:PREDICTED: uncharacterized protein LOC104237470 [Nicotiana sylvestris]XP_016479773.1 PREDICTED: uncharacterized protein LOC107801020 [Nicotiana tabacum]